MGVAALAPGCNREPQIAPPPPLEVVISQPVSEKIEDWDTYIGTLTAKDKVDVLARVRGEIIDVQFEEGKEIEADKLLFVIDDEPFQADLAQAKGQLATWQAKFKAADEQIAIRKPLVDKGTISKEEYINAVAAKGEATGGIETARGKIREAEINIKYCKIRSPIAGKVGRILLTKGNIVNAGGSQNLLTTVVGVDPIYVEFDVNERALQNYIELRRQQFKRDKKEVAMDLTVHMALATSIGYPYQGTIDFTDNTVDPKTGNFKVRAIFKNAKGPDGLRSLIPGESARVRVSISEPYPAILVADRAILTDQTRKYVLVVNKQKDNMVERVDITPANRVQDDGLRAVDADLKGDEWIIVDGVNRARPGAPVAPKEAPMPRRTVAAK
jgi:RND family efflux transporter MFP subunit